VSTTTTRAGIENHPTATFRPVTASRRRVLQRLVGAWLLLMTPAARADVTVLVVTSDQLPQYEAPVAAFSGTLPAGYRTVAVHLSDSRTQSTETFTRAAQRCDPDAVFALGARAAYLSRNLFPKMPLVFAMVVGWQRYGFDVGPTTGVALEMPVDVLFTRFKLMLPDLRTLGVIYGDTVDDSLLKEARKAAAALGIELAEEPVGASDEVRGAYRRLRSRIDGLWMAPDSTVVTRDNFAYLVGRTRSDDIAFLAFSGNFVRAGALLSVAPSYATMGSQAAVLLERLLAHPDRPPAVQPPFGSTLVVNADTARRLDIDLNAALVSMADVIVDDAGVEEVTAR
jgi:putative ABC transport system substrate-binding protein